MKVIFVSLALQLQLQTEVFPWQSNFNSNNKEFLRTAGSESMGEAGMICCAQFLQDWRHFPDYQPFLYLFTEQSLPSVLKDPE